MNGSTGKQSHGRREVASPGNGPEKLSAMMSIYRGDALGTDGLREILGAMAIQFDRCMLFARWDNGGKKQYVITRDDSPVARSPAAFRPIFLALPNGAGVPAREGEHERQIQSNGPS
jgi:hypothetical protein